MPAEPKLIEFVVRTSRAFPLDMLRYDYCWPAKVEDVRLVASMLCNELPPSHHSAQVCIRGLRCTADRWASFGCEIIERKFI